MLEQFFPAHSLRRIGSKHMLYQCFAHLADIVNCSRELYLFFGDHLLELIDVFGVVWRTLL